MDLTAIFKRAIERKRVAKELEEEIRTRKIVEDKFKSADEREVERFREEERQAHLKKELDYYRKKKNDEHWHGNNILKQKNIFKGHKSILHQDKDILENNDKLNSMKSNFLNKGGWK